MKFYKFWTSADCTRRGNKGDVTRSAFGFSNQSLDDAKRVAEQRASHAVDFLLGRGPKPTDHYYHAEQPFREEVIEELSDDGVVVAVITRNSWGCRILNTKNVFFADVDRPYHTQLGPSIVETVLNTVMGFFKKKPDNTASSPTLSFQEKLVAKVEALVQNNPQLGLRLYETKAGFRIAVTSEAIDASEAKSNQLLNNLGADRLYISLCRSQDCYRARLSPKPWRCGSSMTKPPFRFPFDQNEEPVQRKWESNYEKVAQGFATCRLIGQFGNSIVEPSVDKILQLHDHFTLNEELPLA